MNSHSVFLSRELLAQPSLSMLVPIEQIKSGMVATLEIPQFGISGRFTVAKVMPEGLYLEAMP